MLCPSLHNAVRGEKKISNFTWELVLVNSQFSSSHFHPLLYNFQFYDFFTLSNLFRGPLSLVCTFKDLHNARDFLCKLNTHKKHNNTNFLFLYNSLFFLLISLLLECERWIEEKEKNHVLFSLQQQLQFTLLYGISCCSALFLVLIYSTEREQLFSFIQVLSPSARSQHRQLFPVGFFFLSG